MTSASQQNKCGWLRKQGGVVKSWQRRWFILNGDYLFYFIKEDGAKPQDVIPLQGNKIIQHLTNADEPDKFLLELVPVKAPQKMPVNHEMHLLCAASEEERQGWIKAIRKRLFAAKGGAIFGTSLEETMTFERTRSHLNVPYIVDVCIKFLAEYGLEAEGLFRLPGRMLLVRDLKDKFDEGEHVVLTTDEYDVHSVASLLKQYMRELPECLIPYTFYQEFMNVAMRFQGTKSTNNKLEEVRCLCKATMSVPKDNYNTLKYLCNFLHKVADKTVVNKMTTQNLARVFGPNIIRHPQMDDNPQMFMFTTLDISEQLAYMLINYDQQIFSIEFDQGQHSSRVAVDDLLGINNMENCDGVLQPESVLTSSEGMNESWSNMEDLTDIIFEQRYDRRTRTFPTNELYADEKTDKNQHLALLKTAAAAAAADEPSPADSACPLPTNKTCSSTIKDKPVALLWRKYTRNSYIVCEKKSSDSISSESSDLESSLDDDFSGPMNKMNSCINRIKETNIALLDLQHKLEALTAENNNLKARYDNLNVSRAEADERVKNLSAEISKIQSKYEEHIKSIEAKHKSQLNEISAKLTDERSSRDVALQKIMGLQKNIQQYQMLYGESKEKLPPLYQ